MAGSLSDVSELKLLEHMVGKTSWTMPTAYVALCTTDPTDAAVGTEVTGTGYTRIATAGSDWGAAAAGQIANAVAITSPTVGAGGWGTIIAFELWSDLSAGYRIAWGELTVDRTPVEGDAVRFAIGAFVITAT